MLLGKYSDITFVAQPAGCDFEKIRIKFHSFVFLWFFIYNFAKKVISVRQMLHITLCFRVNCV